MCEARFAFAGIAKPGTTSPSPRPGRDVSSCFCGRVSVCGYAVWAAASLFDQLNSVPSIHIRCKMTASFRATATLALLRLLRLATRMPQALKGRPFRDARQKHVGSLVQIASQQSVAAFRDAAGAVDFAGCVSSRGQSHVGTDIARFVEPRWIIDCREIAKCSDRSDAWHRHEAAHVRLVACQIHDLD